MLLSVIEITWKYCVMRSLDYRDKHGLSPAMMRNGSHMGLRRCAIKIHGVSGGIATLHHDLRNSPHHYFRLHHNCYSAFY